MIVWLVALLSALLLARVYLQNNFPYTHDGSNHLARFANYAAALREGQWPPRFAPYLLNGYGFPVFNYNYPLANILASPGVWLNFNPETIFSWQVVAALALGLGSVYQALRLKFSRLASLFGTGVWTSSSYLINTLFYRGNIGELWAYALVPAAWWFLNLAAKHPKKWWLKVVAIVFLTALLLSHNLLGLTGFVMLVFFSWFLKTERQLRICWLQTWLLAAGLSLWFWLPAVMELNLIVLTSDSLASQATNHLLRFAQLTWRPWRFGFSLEGPIDTLNFGLGASGWLIVLFSLVMTLREKAKNQLFVFLLGLSILALWFTTQSSEWVWRSIPVLSIWQFPWRLLFFVSLWLVPLGAWVFSQAKLVLKLILVWLLIIQLAAYFYLPAVDRFHYDSQYYLSFPMTTLTNNENRPRTFNLESFGNWQPQPYLLEGQGEIKVESWLGSKRRYQVKADSDVVVVEPTVYFAGWQVKVDGQRVEPSFPPEAKGQIAYELTARPDKPYQVKTSFGARTPSRLLGEGLSLLSLTSLVYIIYTDQKQK